MLGPRLAERVAGLVVVHTTYTNPVRTTLGARVVQALQPPVLTPLVYRMIALWPAVWLMHWLSFLNGTAHLHSAFTGFAGQRTRAQRQLCDAAVAGEEGPWYRGHASW